MRDDQLFYWGMVVTIFILISAMLTARELFERYLERRATERDPPESSGESTSETG